MRPGRRPSPILPTLLGLLTLCATLPPALAAQSTTLADTNPLPWTKHPAPVFTGQFIASDPSVVFDAASGRYRMAYTCFDLDLTAPFDPATTHAAICLATSPDGLTWTNVPADDATPPAGQVDGLAVRGIPGTWAENLEGSFLLQTPDGPDLLYFSGYRQEGDPAMGYPAALAVAQSTGNGFARTGPDPILAPTPGGPDNDAVYSPTVVPYDGGYAMVYAGHCYTRCDAGPDGPGVRLLGATSPDGLTWTKRPDPVLEALPDLPWTRDGVAEPALILAPDGRWYLFFTALRDADRVIGVARGDSPFGPRGVAPDPTILPGLDGDFDSGGVLAPDVHIEGDTTRIWYLGTTPGEQQFAIGYAEAPWPLWP